MYISKKKNLFGLTVSRKGKRTAFAPRCRQANERTGVKFALANTLYICYGDGLSRVCLALITVGFLFTIQISRCYSHRIKW